MCPYAPVAQLDRALDYGSGGLRFESSRARHFPLGFDTKIAPTHREEKRTG